MGAPLRFRLWRYCHSLGYPRYYYLSGPWITRWTNEIVFSDDERPDYCDETLRTLQGEEILEQWTGIKDLTGRDVYEGDVIREEWDAPAGHLVSDSLIKHGAYEDGEGYKVIGFYRDYVLRTAVTAGESGAPLSVNTSRWTVIGNRHENSELLKETPS